VRGVVGELSNEEGNGDPGRKQWALVALPVALDADIDERRRRRRP
jgi:hypothetical protein